VWWNDTVRAGYTVRDGIYTQVSFRKRATNYRTIVWWNDTVCDGMKEILPICVPQRVWRKYKDLLRKYRIFLFGGNIRIFYGNIGFFLAGISQHSAHGPWGRHEGVW